jgi:hypothetical protein
MSNIYFADSDDYSPSKQPMKRQKPSRGMENKPKFKDDKRKRREAVERKRGNA